MSKYLAVVVGKGLTEFLGGVLQFSLGELTLKRSTSAPAPAPSDCLLSS